MYPAAREVLDDGDKTADHEIEKHGEAELMMKDLEGMDPDDERFDALLTKLIKDVRHHIKDEEDDLLPRLKDSLGADPAGHHTVGSSRL